MRRLIWALLLELFGRIADGVALLSGHSGRKLAQELQTFFSSANQFLVAVQDASNEGILHANGDAIESLGRLRSILVRQMPKVRQGTATELDPRLEARLAAALEQMALPADIDTVVLATVSYSAYVLPAPVSDAYFEHLWHANEEQLSEDILQLRTAKERGWDARVEDMARAVGLSAEELRARRDGNSAENSAILVTLITLLAKRLDA